MGTTAWVRCHGVCRGWRGPGCCRRDLATDGVAWGARAARLMATNPRLRQKSDAPHLPPGTGSCMKDLVPKQVNVCGSGHAGRASERLQSGERHRVGATGRGESAGESSLFWTPHTAVSVIVGKPFERAYASARSMSMAAMPCCLACAAMARSCRKSVS